MKYLPLILLLLFISCTQKKTVTIASKPAFRSGPMDSAYGSIRPALQIFTIDNTKANTITAAKGTAVFIPAGCFVNGAGEAIGGTVQVEIAEAVSLNDFISSGLATMSGDKLLLSKGMIYINAKAGDENLQLAAGQSLTVTMPTMNGNSNSNFKMFTGDGTDWKADSSMTTEDYAVPVPLALLYPDGNKFYFTCISYMGEKDETWSYMDTNIVSATNKRYENTVIATEEYAYRYYWLMGMSQHMSYLMNRDWYLGETECGENKYNYDLFKVYFEHPDRSFKESDSIVKKIYKDYYKVNKEKMLALCEEVNQYKRTYFSNWTDTNYYFDFREKSFEQQYMEPLNNYPKATKELKKINDHGVDLNAKNAWQLLKDKNVTDKEINELLTYNFRRNAKIKEYQNAIIKQKEKEKMMEMYGSTVFNVTTMGWINCDRFFEDPSAGKADIYVSNSSSNSLKFIDCSLVIPDLNVRLMSFPKGNGYSFTKPDGRYTNLPIGKQAVIVGVAMQHDSVFFASKKVKIKDGVNMDLPMKYIPKGLLGDSLRRAVKG